MIGFYGIELPWPPTANHMYTIHRGRKIKSPEYRAWVQSASQSLAMPPSPIVGPWVVIFDVSRPDNRRRDLDNLLKQCLDLLVLCGVVEDDSKCQSITIRWTGDVVAGGKLMAWVKAA